MASIFKFYSENENNRFCSWFNLIAQTNPGNNYVKRLQLIAWFMFKCKLRKLVSIFLMDRKYEFSMSYGGIKHNVDTCVKVCSNLGQLLSIYMWTKTDKISPILYDIMWKYPNLLWNMAIGAELINSYGQSDCEFKFSNCLWCGRNIDG